MTTHIRKPSTSTIADLHSSNIRPTGGLWHLALRHLRRDYQTIAATVVIFVLAILALLAPVISRQILEVDYTRTGPEIFLPVGSEGHLLGTDDVGRDYFSRLLYGARVSLGIAFSVAIFSLGIGVAVGSVAGYYQGGPLKVVDDLLMWFITTLNTIPTLFLLIMMVAVLSKSAAGSSVSFSALSLVLVLTFFGWTGTMRLMRGETLAERERDYVVAARAIGASDLRIMFTHILPNVMSLVVVTLALDIGGLILTESALSYVGFGVQEPTPSWGGMLTDAKTFYHRGWHLVGLPGGLIIITVFCLFIIGDGLRDAPDPETSQH
jgi:peptide/nickel transport system permease protein